VKQLEVTIMGHGYILGCPEGGEALLTQAVARVDQEMSHIRDSGKVKARERIAVLAALNLAYLLAEAAQRPTTVPGAATAAPVPPACALPTAMPPGADGLDVDALMQRVDAALGDDGQLL
jgi:cell division protein ZapA